MEELHDAIPDIPKAKLNECNGCNKGGMQGFNWVSYYLFIAILVYDQVWHPKFSYTIKYHLAVALFHFQPYSPTPSPIIISCGILALSLFLDLGFILVQKSINRVILFRRGSTSCLLLYFFSMIIVGVYVGLPPPLPPLRHFLPLTGQVVFLLSLFILSLPLFFLLYFFEVNCCHF